MAILTANEQQSFKPISANWIRASKELGGVSKYEQMALEVEVSKLQPLIGVKFLQDLQSNPSTVANSLLLNGGSFIDCEGDTITFKGLKYAIAYLNFYQYISESYVADTYTGFAQKTRPEAESLSSSQRKEIQISTKGIFDSEFDIITLFLNENKEDYPFWKCSIKRPFRPVISTIRKTIN